MGIAIVLAVALAGCSSGDDDGEPTTTTADPSKARMELPQTGGCGEAFFWAATTAGDVAVTVLFDAADRPSDRPTRLAVSLPSGAASVRVLRGTNVPRNFCTDVIDTKSQPKSASRAAAGELRIVLDPAPTQPVVCNKTSVSGRMDLDGLVADDGTAFTPISVTTNTIGCVSG
jgi:hypothetical protein